MWKNKDIKRRARKSLKANYFAIIALCFVLTFFGVLSGTGAQITSAGTSDIPLYHEPAPFSVNDMTPQYTPGLVTYLNDFFAGGEESRQIAGNVLDRFQDTGGLVYNIMYRVDKFVFTHDTAAKSIVCIAIIAYLAYYFLLRNVLQVGFSRFLMETRTYGNTGFNRVFFLFKKGGVMRSAAIMLARTLFLAAIAIATLLPIVISIFIFLATEALWYIPIGALLSVLLACIYISQHYSLFLVPYILAENPTMRRKDVFALSRDMMKGNRLHALGLELSFIGWKLLSIITVGILSALYVMPYAYLSRTEMYMILRQNAIDSNMQNAIYLNDDYLTLPPKRLLEEANIQNMDSVVIFPLSYPELKPFKSSRLIEHVRDLDPSRHYKIITLVLFFFIFSFIGWCWEVSIHLVKDAAFVNRGTMLGPWLPIYGVGGVMIITLLKRFAKKPAVLFVATVVLCCIIEYAASWYIEKTLGLKYWDYSDYFLNINGRICLEGALIFAIGGLLFVYIAGPMLDNLLAKLNAAPKLIVAIILVMLFGTDFTYSHFHPNQGDGITDYGSNAPVVCRADEVFKPMNIVRRA